MTAYHFDDFVLNIARGNLTRAGREVFLRPKSFELLRHLVANAGRLVGKDELLATVWPGLHVSDDVLTQCVMEIRKAIDDDAHEIVRTVPKRGYVFSAPVAARHEALGGGREAAMARTPSSAARQSGALLLVVGLVIGVLIAVSVPHLVTRIDAARSPDPASITRLISGAETVLGQRFAFPAGTPAITVDLVPMPPGGESGWHSHPVPVVGYVLKGQVTTDYGQGDIKTYTAGDALIEAIDRPHNARNDSAGTTLILIVALGAEGVESRVAASPFDRVADMGTVGQQ